jgi:steroid 5-alpha reductase family enzyme
MTQLLLFIITAPTYVLLLSSRISGNTFSTYDHLFSKAIFLIILVEFYADQQQWNFHQAKSSYKSTAKVPKDHSYTREQLDRGFNTSGLWAWSRHPNFAAEQAVWVSLYQWCCCETYTFMNWCFMGAISYLFLFQASTWLTEMLSAKKYPEYKVYQKRVGKFLPKVTTESMDAAPKAQAEDKKSPNAAKASGKGKKGN